MSTGSRILLAGTFLYSAGSAFNPAMAAYLYYTHVIIMLFFNIILSTSRPSLDWRYPFGLLLNSLSSTYCYNYYDCLWKTVKTCIHQPSFIRQGLFYTVIFLENIILTILILQKPSPISDSWLLPSWLLQLSSWLLMFLYYLCHPASVSITSYGHKMQVRQHWSSHKH